jgi:hypothetical protein
LVLFHRKQVSFDIFSLNISFLTLLYIILLPGIEGHLLSDGKRIFQTILISGFV